MSSFSEEIYPYRQNRGNFTHRLLNKIDTHWTEVARLSGARDNADRPGDVLRCTVNIHSGSYNCNFRPAIIDKIRVRAVLKAWSRSISDRYLDATRVSQLNGIRHNSEREAFDLIKQNYPVGAVMFVMNEIERSRSPYLFGIQLWEGWSYNTYFTNILRWDDQHCYGLVARLRQDQARRSGAGVPSHLWTAARRWLAANQGNGIYKEFGVTLE